MLLSPRTQPREVIRVMRGCEGRGRSIWLTPPLLAAPSATDDEPVGPLPLLARPVAQRRDAPRCNGVAARRVVRFAAAVRVIHGVHRHAARLGPLAAVAGPTRLAEVDELVLGVSEDADRGPALDRNHPHLARG